MAKTVFEALPRQCRTSRSRARRPALFVVWLTVLIQLSPPIVHLLHESIEDGDSDVASVDGVRPAVNPAPGAAPAFLRGPGHRHDAEHCATCQTLAQLHDQGQLNAVVLFVPSLPWEPASAVVPQEIPVRFGASPRTARGPPAVPLLSRPDSF